MKNENSSHWVTKIAKRAVITTGIALTARAILKSFRPSVSSQLEDKVVLITGGGRGLGLILAKKLASENATVVICGRSEQTLRRASSILASKTDKHLAIPCDVTDREQVKQMIQKVREDVGSVDVLINNAGKIQTGPVETMNQSDYEEAMNVHFWGPFYLINEVLPEMKEKKAGNIVNIASIGSKISFPHLLPYNISKYALSGFSEGLAAELKKYNIKVTSVYPGLMRTGSPRNIDVKGQHQKEYAWFKITSSLPIISMDADRAADKIIRALKKGERTLTMSIPAKMAVAAHGIAPGAVIAAFNVIDFLMPRKAENGETKKGYESESRISSSFLTKKTDLAAVKNLEK